MKITFITPHFKNIWESLGIGYIVSHLKNHSSVNLDIKCFHGNFDSVQDMIEEGIKSDVVAFSCTTPTFKEGLRVATIIKKVNPKVCIVFGSWHVTADNTLHNDIIDFTILGEGEGSMLALIQSGMVGKYKGTLVGSLLEFDKLHWPDRKVIKQERTLDLCEKMCGERIGSFQSRRGCPLSCVFCAESSMTRTTKVRVRDPEDTLNEVEYVYDKYNITKFKFVDPTWCFPKSAAIDFCNAKIKRGFKLPWECMAHTAFLTKDILKLMKEANCNQINIGVESGSQRLLNEMRKGTTVNRTKKVFKWGKELNLNMRGFFLLGMPTETIESIEETKQLVREIQPDVFGMTILTPFPGSDLYSEKYKDEDWSKCDEYSCDFWKTENFTNADLVRIQKEFNDEFKDNLVNHQR